MRGGPLGIFLGYSFVGFICYLVMVALGEMAAYLPHKKGFLGYATRFVDPAFGFALGWNYVLKYVAALRTRSIQGTSLIQRAEGTLLLRQITSMLPVSSSSTGLRRCTSRSGWVGPLRRCILVSITHAQVLSHSDLHRVQ